MFHLLRILGWSIAAAAYIITFVVALSLGIFLITPAGWVFLPFVVVLGAAVAGRLHRRRAGAVLGYVEGAVRLNLPLAVMVRSAAMSESGRLHLRLTGLTKQLEMGRSLAMSLGSAVPEVPVRTRSLIESAERLGRLPRVLTRLVAQSRLAGQREGANTTTIWGYPIAVGATVVAVVAGLTVLILPKFVEIFEDFGVQLPPITQRLLRVGMWLAGGGLWWLALAMVALIAVAVLLQFPVGRVLFGPILWYLPVIGGIERDRGLGDACHLIEEALDAGVPLPEALREAADLRTNPMLRRKLERWASRVEAGDDVGDAAAAARLPTLLVGMFSSGQASGSLREAAGFLSRFYDERFSRLGALLQAAATPAVVLVLAVIVGWIVVGLFYPLVVLIEATIPQGWVVL